MDNLEICRMSALEVRDGIKAKKLSPVEVIDAVLQRIERINPKVNAYYTVAAESAKAEAKQIDLNGYQLNINLWCL